MGAKRSYTWSQAAERSSSRDASTSSSRTWAPTSPPASSSRSTTRGPRSSSSSPSAWPRKNGANPPSEKRTVRRADRPTLPAGEERRFEYLADAEVGNHDLTQFLGVIDPSRVPAHGHVYDEVIYVVEGEGTLHLDGKTTPISTGSCIHLPPRIAHTLENHGPGPMRVLGVFHPAGDPAGRAYEETK